jgi:hypothetical protein
MPKNLNKRFRKKYAKLALQCFAIYGFSYFDPIDGCGDYSACIACPFPGWV